MSDMSEIFDAAARRSQRRQELLDRGLGLADLEEYNVLTLQLAMAAPALLRAINDVIKLKDELLADESAVSAVARAFAAEIYRALEGQR